MQEPLRNRFRPGRLENYRHHWMMVFWFIYLICFVLAECIPASSYHVIHTALDDTIPFCRWFIFPYCTWHPLLALMTVYLAFWDVEGFKPYMAFIALGLIPSCLFCFVYPSMQQLRPSVLEGNDLAIRLIRLIYAADTPTNVFPSMHVIGAAALAAATIYAPTLRKRKIYLAMIPLAVLISVSTVFVKQHSVLDLFAAVPYSALVWWLVYGVIFKKVKKPEP